MRYVILVLPILLSAQTIPRTWNSVSVSSLELPLAQPDFSPVHISEADYYRIRERLLYRTYPVYHPDREPAGYFDWLRQQEPAIAFNPSDYHTPNHWIAAGQIVFNAPTSFDPLFFSLADLRDPAFYSETGMPVAADGIVPFAR